MKVFYFDLRYQGWKVSARNVFLSSMFILLMLIPLQVSASNGKGHSLFLMGMSHEAFFQVFAARNYFADAVREEPGNRGYKEHYAWFLSEYGFNEEALPVFSSLSEPDTTDAVNRGLAWNQLAIGKLAESVATYRKIFTDISPTTRDAQALIEIRSKLSDENNNKISRLLLLISKSPADISAKRELFRTYVYQGKYIDAQQVGEQIRNEIPDDIHFHWEFARMFYWGNQLDRANTEFAAMASAHPDNPFILLEWAKVQLALNKPSEAGSNLEKAFALAPSTPEIVKDLAEFYARQGDSDKSLHLAQSLYSNKSRPLAAALTEARCYYLLGDQVKARSCYKQILATYPENAEALIGLAESSLKSGAVYETASSIKKLEDIKYNDSRIYAVQEILRTTIVPQFNVQTDLYGNSNKYSRLNSSLSVSGSPWSGLLAGAGYTFSEFKQNGYTTVNRQSVFLQADKRLTHSLLFTGRLEGTFYDNAQNNLNIRLSSIVTPNSSSVIKLSFDHIDIIDSEPVFDNQLYNPVVSIGAVHLKVTTNDYSLYLQQKLSKEVALWGKFIFGAYSDNNQKVSAVLGGDYSPAMFPALKVSYSYYYLDYLHKAPESAYFDPSNFLTHTIGLAYKEKAGRFSYGGEWYLNYLQRSNGIGNTLSGFAEFSLNETQKLHFVSRNFYQNKGENRDSLSGYFSAYQILLSYSKMF